MRKLLMILLSLLLLFSLVACGNNDTPGNYDPLNRDPGTSQTGSQGGTQSGTNDPADIDFNSILAGNGSTDVVWGKQDEATKQMLIDEAEKDGLTVTFGNDGSMTLTDEEGNKHVQKADGTWTYTGKDGDSVNIGGNWPDNDLAKLVPAANFTISASTYYDGNCAISFSGVTLDQIKAYVEQVKSAGFDNDVTLTDNAGYYSYQAYDDAGNSAQVFFTAGIGGLNMRAADPYDE